VFLPVLNDDEWVTDINNFLLAIGYQYYCSIIDEINCLKLTVKLAFRIVSMEIEKG